MKTNIKLYALSGMVFGLSCLLPRVSLAAGYELHNIAEKISGIYASGSSDVVIGPNAQISVDGDWYITASNVYIHPSAQITGTGTIHLMNPATYGATAAATNLDAGGVSIGCKLSVENSKTVTLGYINPASSYAASGITDTHAAGSDDLVMANNLNFNNAGAHVILGNANVQFTSAAAATVTYSDLNTAGFSPDPAPGADYTAYLVTGGSGVVTKQGLGTATAFTYPVGQSGPSSAPYDYTPATVTNTAAARDLSVQVKSYANSSATEGNAAYGIDRTWQITGSASGTATVALQNNSGSEGASYTRNTAFVTQQVNTGVWDIATGSAATTPNYTHSRSSLTVPVSGITSFFSKSSDASGSVSQNTQLDLVAGLQGSMQSNGTMRNDMQNYWGSNSGLLPVNDPYSTGASCPAINNPSGAAGNVVDWVKVEVRDAVNPSNILQTRALLLKTDGHIVDTAGKAPLFNGTASAVKVAVWHRNHLAILSNNIGNGAFRGQQTYDFTTALSQASNLFGDPAQMKLSGGKWCMWAGDIDQDFFVDGTDYGLVNYQISQSAVLDETYNRYDVTLDAFTDGTDKGAVQANKNFSPVSTLVNY